MITKQGQEQLLKVVASRAQRFADLIVVGSSNKTLPNTTTQLDFGWATCPILGSYIDPELNQIVFHGTLPEMLSGDVYEIGLISQSDEFVRSGLANALVYTFEPNEMWYSNVDYEVTNTGSVGRNNYKLNNAAVGDFVARSVGEINVSQYDRMQFKLKATGVSKIKVTFKNDELRYAHKTITTVAGEQTLDEDISTFTQVGVFDPKRVTEIKVEVVTRVATNNIEFDAMNISSRVNGGLVCRDTLAIVQYKRNGSTMEIEYAVSFGAVMP